MLGLKPTATSAELQNAFKEKLGLIGPLMQPLTPVHNYILNCTPEQRNVLVAFLQAGQRDYSEVDDAGNDSGVTSGEFSTNQKNIFVKFGAISGSIIVQKNSPLEEIVSLAAQAIKLSPDMIKVYDPGTSTLLVNGAARNLASGSSLEVRLKLPGAHKVKYEPITDTPYVVRKDSKEVLAVKIGTTLYYLSNGTLVDEKGKPADEKATAVYQNISKYLKGQ